MTTLDLDAVRRVVRALDYSRGSGADAAIWREDDEDTPGQSRDQGHAA